MASQFDILAAIQALVKTTLDALSPALVYQAAIGYPPIRVLQNIAKYGQAGVDASATPVVIAIYDRKISRNSTRWNPYVFEQTVVPATLTTSISQSTVAPGQTARITLGGHMTDGDSVSALAVAKGANTGAVVVTGTASDTPSTMATALAAAINSNASLSGVLTATVAGPVVTIRNVSSIGLSVASYAGNGGTQQREIGRRDQQVQVICWAQTVELRNTVTAALAVAIAQAELDFVPVGADAVTGRLYYVSDYDLEDDTLEDVFRHDYMVGMDYPVTVTDALFAVLAPVANISVQLTVGG